jgi:hypothetical protein
MEASGGRGDNHEQLQARTGRRQMVRCANKDEAAPGGRGGLGMGKMPDHELSGLGEGTVWSLPSQSRFGD